MNEPTKISLDEAAVAADYNAWPDARFCAVQTTVQSIRAHALTLDQLHGRKHPEPVDPLLIEAREITAAYNKAEGYETFANGVIAGNRDGHPEVKATLAALKRGMELAAPVPVDDAIVENALVRIRCIAIFAHNCVNSLRNAGFVIIAAPHGDA